MTEVLVHRTAADLRAALKTAGFQGWDERVALVPTMGYLHEGHATLIRRAAELAPRVVVSIFVNPLQFGPNEDLERYPRDFDRDLDVCARAGATDLYFPTPEELTPSDMEIFVDPGRLADRLCGRSRPGHFRGVCTIVTKLFNIVQPSVAVFGWKDAQQQIILRKTVKDLNIPLRIEGVETVREPDGLALSSRNIYLSPVQRAEAVNLSLGLNEARDLALNDGETDGDLLCEVVAGMISDNTAGEIDYIECVAMDDLRTLREVQLGNTMIAAAVRFGNTRLIDNVRF